MKKQKMSLEKMKTVLDNVLSREEMKELVAGSNLCPGMFCQGIPWDSCTYISTYGSCRCSSNPMFYTCA